MFSQYIFSWVQHVMCWSLFERREDESVMNKYQQQTTDFLYNSFSFLCFRGIDTRSQWSISHCRYEADRFFSWRRERRRCQQSLYSCCCFVSAGFILIALLRCIHLFNVLQDGHPLFVSTATSRTSSRGSLVRIHHRDSLYSCCCGNIFHITEVSNKMFYNVSVCKIPVII